MPIMASTPVQRMPLNDEVFGRLKAEHEAAWLNQVFVEPPDFDAMMSMRPFVVFGASGAGKTALRMALALRATQSGDEPATLVVYWSPTLPSAGLTGSDAVQVCLAQVLDVCALALLRYLSRQPTSFHKVSGWVQETIIWFVHQHLQGDRTLHLSRLEEGCDTAGIELLRDLFARTPREVLKPDAPPARIIGEISGVTQRLGLAGVWVLVDGLNPWVEADAGLLTQMLGALLSTLVLFEEAGFAMKLVVPIDIEAALTGSGGIRRRRLDVYRLEYPVEWLIAIVERRLAAVTGRDMFRLSDLCDSEELQSWLKRCGGQVPRAWLSLVGPLARAYMAGGTQRPLKIEECVEILRRRPPMIHLDLATGRFWIGESELTGLSPISYKMLRYLYEQRRTVGKDELYYRVYRNLSAVPRSSGDGGWEIPQDWSGMFDTIIWRLRKEVEPYAKKPIYIITERGRGLRLENAWRDS